MNRYRKYTPLLAGPVFFLLFVVTGALLGPSSGGAEKETVYELTRRLSGRTAALEEAESTLVCAERYLARKGPEEEGSAYTPPADPATEWASMMTGFPDGSYSWNSLFDRNQARYELTLHAPFTSLFRWLGELDRRNPGFAIDRFRLTGEGEEATLTLVVVPVAGGEGS